MLQGGKHVTSDLLSVLHTVQLNDSMCSLLQPDSGELERLVEATANFNGTVAGSIVMVSHLGTFAHEASL